jgi:beta-lactamase superfamily II metal-dependent hydrolase
LAALLLILIAGAASGWFFFKPRIQEWWTRSAPEPSGKELRVHVLDVGHGDSILVVAPSGKVVLIDAGETGDGKRIVEAMQRYGAAQIDLLIATHAHADHIGGADELIKAADVREVIYSGAPSTTKDYQDFLKAIDEKKVPLVKAAPGRTFDLGDGIVLTILAPIEPFFTKEDMSAGGNEPNANSVVARIDYGDFSMLFAGDAEAQTEERMLRQDARLEADVLKVGHHGSKYATSERFVTRGQFKAAIVSAGLDNRYGQPSQEVLDRLRASGAKLYRTDFQGDLSVSTRGMDEFKVETAREPKAGQDLWAGRQALRDDSSKRGFIQFGDLPPAPTPKPPKPEKASKKASAK